MGLTKKQELVVAGATIVGTLVGILAFVNDVTSRDDPAPTPPTTPTVQAQASEPPVAPTATDDASTQRPTAGPGELTRIVIGQKPSVSKLDDGMYILTKQPDSNEPYANVQFHWHVYTADRKLEGNDCAVEATMTRSDDTAIEETKTYSSCMQLDKPEKQGHYHLQQPGEYRFHLKVTYHQHAMEQTQNISINPS